MIDIVSVFGIVLEMIDRRDVKGLAIDHLRNRLIVHVRGVFD
jgi:hypothetical protein